MNLSRRISFRAFIASLCFLIILPAYGSGDSCKSVVKDHNARSIISKVVRGETKRPAAMRSLYELDRIKVLNFNLKNALTYKGRFVVSNQRKFKLALGKRKRPKIKREMRQIAEIINQEQPDFITLQEHDGPDSLERMIEHYLKPKGAYSYAFYPGNDFRGVEIAILYRNDLNISVEYVSNARLKYQSEQIVWQKSMFSRDLAFLHIFANEDLAKVVESGDMTGFAPALILGVGHYKSKLDAFMDPNSIIFRQAQLVKTRELTEELSERFPDTPILIGADWNVDLAIKEESDVLFDNNLYIDPFDIVGLQADERTTHVWFPDEELTTKPKLTQLDGILATNVSLKDFANSVISSGVVPYVTSKRKRPKKRPITREKLALQGSDHNAIWLEFKTSLLNLGLKKADLEELREEK